MSMSFHLPVQQDCLACKILHSLHLTCVEHRADLVASCQLLVHRQLPQRLLGGSCKSYSQRLFVALVYFAMVTVCPLRSNYSQHLSQPTPIEQVLLTFDIHTDTPKS